MNTPRGFGFAILEKTEEFPVPFKESAFRGALIVDSDHVAALAETHKVSLDDALAHCSKIGIWVI